MVALLLALVLTVSPQVQLTQPQGNLVVLNLQIQPTDSQRTIQVVYWVEGEEDFPLTKEWPVRGNKRERFEMKVGPGAWVFRVRLLNEGRAVLEEAVGKAQVIAPQP